VLAIADPRDCAGNCPDAHFRDNRTKSYTMSGIEPVVSVREYFGEHVARALRDLRLQTAPATEGYLVGLLSGYAVSEQVQALAQPLVALLQRALGAHGLTRQARLRELGDSALFLSGFFPESFERRGVDAGYAATMGGRAYLLAGSDDRDGDRRAVLSELARRFVEFARVLDEVRERTEFSTDAAVLQLYERWLRSGSPAVARRLARRGVPAPRAKPSGPLH
jgi:hypothetical protein